MLQTLVDELARHGAHIREAEPEIDTRRLNRIFLLLFGAATSARASDADIGRLKDAAHRASPADLPCVEQIIKSSTLLHREWLGLANERMKMRRQFNTFFADRAIVLCPTAATAAWPHDLQGERWQRTIPATGEPVPTTDQVFRAEFSGALYLPSTVGPAGYQAIATSGWERWATAFSRLVQRAIGGLVPPPDFDQVP